MGCAQPGAAISVVSIDVELTKRRVPETASLPALWLIVGLRVFSESLEFFKFHNPKDFFILDIAVIATSFTTFYFFEY